MSVDLQTVERKLVAEKNHYHELADEQDGLDIALGIVRAMQSTTADNDQLKVEEPGPMNGPTLHRPLDNVPDLQIMLLRVQRVFEDAIRHGRTVDLSFFRDVTGTITATFQERR